jgi:hypothetical protein
MPTSILGIDIAIQRFEAVLLINGEIKNKSFRNIRRF